MDIKFTSNNYMNDKINFIQNHIKNLQNEITNLPYPWTYAVSKDGRVFFINEQLKITTWLHPITQKPVENMIIPALEELPNGIEKSTHYGVPYYIDHNRQLNTFNLNNNNQQQQQQQVKFSPNSESNEIQIINESIKKSGYLFKLNQTGFKLWKKRYFVLKDHILDYYSDDKQTKHSGTLFLHDTQTRLWTKTNSNSKQSKYSFKIEWKVSNNDSKATTKGLVLAADTYELAIEWVAQLNRASNLNRPQLKSIIKNTTNKIREYSPSPVNNNRSTSAPISPQSNNNMQQRVTRAQSNFALNTNDTINYDIKHKRSSSLNRTNNCDLDDYYFQQHQQQQQHNQAQYNRYNVNNSKRYKSDQHLQRYDLDFQGPLSNEKYNSQFIKNDNNRTSYNPQQQNHQQQQQQQQQQRVITNTQNHRLAFKDFYNLNKVYFENLPSNELKMIIRQLKRNLILLEHSNQRFQLLHAFYEPYEQASYKPLVYLYESFKLIKDRLKDILLKADLLNSCIETASRSDSISNTRRPLSTSDEPKELLKLYEYQMVELEHEYEILLEDKLIIEKLIDNLKQFSSMYGQIVNENLLRQQLNDLNIELESLKSQLNKVIKMKKDTYAEKCEQEMRIYENELKQTPRFNNDNTTQQFKIDHYFNSTVKNNEQTTTTPNNDIQFNSTIWKKPISSTISQDPYRSRGFIQRDVVRERRRASIGRSSNGNLNNSNETSSTSSGQQHQQQIQLQQSAMERLFGVNNRGNDPSKRVALVRPELRGDIDTGNFYEQQIEKKLSKPEVLQIPERYFDTSDFMQSDHLMQQHLSDNEIQAKEKKIHDLKRLIVAQSLANDLNISNISNEIIDIEKEKQDREQLLDLNRSLAEEFKVKSRQNADSNQRQRWYHGMQQSVKI